MTPEHFRSVRDKHGRNQNDMGLLIGYADKSAQRNVSRFETGVKPIPLPIAQLVRYIELYGPLPDDDVIYQTST